MSTPGRNSPEIARLRDASEWVQRLNEPDAEAALDEWLQWCGSDPLNLSTFERLQRLWNAFPEGSRLALPAKSPATAGKHRSKLAALAAGVALLGGLVGWLTFRSAQVLVIDTPVGEQRRVTLPDGSQLDVAPDSHVSTHFSAARRELALERGQVFFEVAHHSLRPFTVHVNNLSVTTLSTAFDVRTGPSSTVVTVSAGMVKVTPGTGGPAAKPRSGVEPVHARAGQRLTFSTSTRRLTLAEVGPMAAGSWRGGTLQFMGEPLEDVAGAINRYRRTRIVVAPELRQMRFTGTVSPSEVGDWLEALEKIYACKVVDRGAEGILIQARVYSIARN